MQIFWLAITLYPDIQKRAHEELDNVIGAERLPELEDRESLPYINAIIMECLRWHPVVPIGVPHRCVADDEYKGYFIPKGTVVVGNAW